MPQRQRRDLTSRGVAMAMKQLCKLRNAAFHRQQGRCYYCGLSMWLDSPDKFMLTYSVTKPAALNLRCTAEHLLPRREGGRDDVRNIVAACWWCNNRRHRGRRKPLSPIEFRTLVQHQMAKGSWHWLTILTKMGISEFGLRPRTTSRSADCRSGVTPAGEPEQHACVATMAT